MKNHIRSEREAHRLMSTYYPDPKPGAHYMPRAQRHMTRHDWELFGAQMLAVFNLCLWFWIGFTYWKAS